MQKHAKLYIITNLDGAVIDSRVSLNATDCPSEISWEFEWRADPTLFAIGALTAVMLTAALCTLRSIPLFSLPATTRITDPDWILLPESRPNALLLAEGVRVAATFWLGLAWGQMHAIHLDQFWSVYTPMGLTCGYLYRRLGGKRWVLHAFVFPVCWLLLFVAPNVMYYMGLYLGVGLSSSYLGWVLARRSSAPRKLFVHATMPTKFGGLILLVVLSMVASVRILETSAILLWDSVHAPAAMGLGFLYTVQLCIHGACTTTLLAFLRVGRPRAAYLTASTLLHVALATVVLYGKVDAWGRAFTIPIVILNILAALYANVVSSVSASIFMRLIDYSHKMD